MTDEKVMNPLVNMMAEINLPITHYGFIFMEFIGSNTGPENIECDDGIVYGAAKIKVNIFKF